MMQRLRASLITAAAAALVLSACAPQAGPGRELALTDAPQYGSFLWHDLITDDVAAARDFYGPLLGWSFEEARRPSGGPYTLIVSAEGQYVGGMVALEDPDNGDDYSRWLGYYAVPDVDAAAAAAAESGGEVLLHPRNVANLARVAVVRDPAGAVVGLITSKVGYPVEPLAVDAGAVAWNELLAADPGAAAAWYAELSNSEVREEQRDAGLYRVLRNEGRERAGVIPKPNHEVTPLWLTYFAVEDPEAAVHVAAGRGGTVLVAPSADVRSGRIALLTDPTGAVFGLRRMR